MITSSSAVLKKILFVLMGLACNQLKIALLPMAVLLTLLSDAVMVDALTPTRPFALFQNVLKSSPSNVTTVFALNLPKNALHSTFQKKIPTVLATLMATPSTAPTADVSPP
jgi:hypothetical protein